MVRGLHKQKGCCPVHALSVDLEYSYESESNEAMYKSSVGSYCSVTINDATVKLYPLSSLCEAI